LTPFIYPFQANYLRNELRKLLNVVYFAGDYRVYQATKDSLESNIQTLFGHLTSEQASLFRCMTDIKNQRDLNEIMESLRPYLIPFPFDTGQIKRIFKKEKKLTIPDPANYDLRTMSYFGWRDIGTHSVYLVYPYMGELTGIRARYTEGNTSKLNVCCLCNSAFKGTDVGLVVANTKAATYQSVGNYMCLDSSACNQRITSVHAIEEFFQRALSR
jgi:hypothetical protein